MAAEDWLNVGLTMILIFGLLTGARYLKVLYIDSIPKWSPSVVLLVYNGLVAALVLLDRYTGLTLPAVFVPVAVVGGNAALVSLFGLPPGLRRRNPKSSAAKSDIDPNRERIVPTAKKKRHKKHK